MPNIEAQLPTATARTSDVAPDGTIGFVIVVSVALAIALAATALLVRDAAEPLVLLILCGLATVGVFFLFAAGVGLLRLDERRSDLQALTAFAEEFSDGLLIRDDNGETLYANPAFRRLTGSAPGRERASLEEIASGATFAAEAFFRLSRAASRGYAADEEIVLSAATAAGAEPRVVRFAVNPLGAAAGRGALPRWSAWRLSEVAGATVGEAAEAARLLEVTLAAFDGLALPVFAVAADRTVRFANDATTTLIGLDAATAQLGGRPLMDFVSGDPEEVHAALEAATRGDLPAPVLQLKRADGSTLGVAITAKRIGTSDPVVICLANARAAEQAASESRVIEARFARFFRTAPVAIASLGAGGSIGNANAAFERMFRSGRAKARTLADCVAEESRVAVREALAAARRGSEAPPPVEIRFGDGDKQIGQLFLSAMPAGEGDPDAAIVYGVDLTAQRELELQIAQSQKMQAVGQLAGGIAHDFNNVLTVIIGFSDLLLANHRPTDPAFRDIVAIKQNANRAASLVRQLLAFSRRQTLRPEVLLLTDVISDLSVFLSRLLGERIKLKVTHGRDLWYLKADVTQFEQVIINLAVNARDAMSDGGKLTVRTSNLSEADSRKFNDAGVVPGEYVLCEVTDTGCGMTPEIMAKIFEPFFSTKEVGKGTGLGLSTVYGIVKQTGGYIYCDSKPGKGTTFRIYLPRFQPTGDTAVAVKVEKRDKPRDLTGTGTILLVEDEEAVRRFAARALQRQGYTVLEAATGAEALDVMAGVGGKVDLVVSDIVMPEMDGPALLKALRRTKPELRIIFISGYAEDALKSLDGGEEYQFLPKPFQLKELVAAVKETLER